MGNAASGSIETKTYRKSVAGNTVLKATSCHPIHTIKSVPVGELTQIKINCSNDLVYREEEEKARDRLRKRQYPEWMLNRASDFVKRKLLDLLNYRSVANSSYADKPTFVTSYSCEFKKIRGGYSKIPISEQDDSLCLLLKDGCGFSTRKPPNLASILSPNMPQVRPQEHWLSQGVFFRCPMCKFTIKTNSVVDAISRESRYIKQFIL